MNQKILDDYERAREIYAEIGVDADAALEKMERIPVSLQSWQGDDIKGFEDLGDIASQNVVTGCYPGAARNGEELRADIERAISLSIGKHKVNLQTVHAEGGRARKDVRFEDFGKWVAWAKERGYALDLSVSCFAHPEMRDGDCLASENRATRDYWVEACRGARAIADQFGRTMGETCVMNLWIPDGMKDIPVDRFHYRELLKESLDRIFADKYDRKHSVTTLEGKLFSIGVESYTVGSHEFYAGYAIKNGTGICLDTGHYHPTESVVDKISSWAPFIDDILLHVTRGVRWDSDHVVIFEDELVSLMQQLKRGNLYGKVHIGMDYFDASINRIAAWVVGLRAVRKAILASLLEPTERLKEVERAGDFTARLVLSEECKNLPLQAVWEYALARAERPRGEALLEEIRAYERSELSKRV